MGKNKIYIRPKINSIWESVINDARVREAAKMLASALFTLLTVRLGKRF